MLRRTGHNRTVDWYLLGVLIYEMLVGIPPYFSSNRDELFQNIQKAQLKLPKILSEEAKNLITSVKHFSLILLI
jgi:serine/threonine protein kinase